MPNVIGKGRRLRASTSVMLTGLTAVLFILITFAAMAWQRREDLLRDQVLTNGRIAETLAEHVTGLFRQSDLLLSMVSERLERERNLAPRDPAFRDFLSVMLNKAPLVAAVRVAAPDGSYLHSYPDQAPDGIVIADRDYILAHLNGEIGLFVGKPVISRVNGLWVLPLSRAHRAPDGRLKAITTIVIRLDRLNGLFDAIRTRPNGTVALFGKDGTMLARGPMDVAMMGRNFSSGPLFRELAASPAGDYTDVVTTDRQLRQVSYRPAEHFPVLVGVTSLFSDTLSVWHTYVRMLASIGVPLILAAAAITWVLHRQVRERERAERLLARRSADLELANEEIRYMAEISAHHLQEPLRTVMSYSQLLVRKARVAGEDELKHYLSFITGGIERMRHQLGALQRYLGMDQCRPHEDVSLSQILAEALAGLRPLLIEAGTVLKTPPLPEIRGDRQQLTGLFHHLISAILGRRTPERRQTIDIAMSRDGESWHLCVTADHTDIDFGEEETSFPLLEPGSAANRGGGPTLSLALCRKITRLHGGRMWAETDANGLTRLHVLLPAG